MQRATFRIPSLLSSLLVALALFACAEADPAEGARPVAQGSGTPSTEPTVPPPPAAGPMDTSGVAVPPPLGEPMSAAEPPAAGEPPAVATPGTVPPAAVDPSQPVATTPPAAPTETGMPPVPAPDPVATPVPTDPVAPDPVGSAPEPAATAPPAADELPEDSCKGIKKDMACSTPGTCSNLLCGLADTGSRVCTCDTTWTCTSCEFPTGPDAPSILTEPTADAPLVECDTATVIEEEPCATMGERCALGEDVCACWLTDSDGATIWDCDSPPW